MKQRILSALGSSHPWAETLQWHDTVGSTNDLAKQLAQQGAPQGTVVIAGRQTQGRGRMGRSFASPDKMGIYLSVILRPDCPANALMHLTCAVAVAMCDAIEEVAGFRPGVKWINDLVANKKKLGGILTELAFGSSGQVSYAVVGIGINCHQTAADFPPELQDIAISLDTAANKPTCDEVLAAAMVRHLFHLSTSLFSEKAATMDRYRHDCVTLNQEITVLQGEDSCRATATGIDDDGALLVRYHDGKLDRIATGEVSVRGLYSYC